MTDAGRTPGPTRCAAHLQYPGALLILGWLWVLLLLLLQVAEVWQAKAAYEAAHGPCCLQTFLHEHLRALAVSSCASPAAAAADGAPQAPAAAAAGAPLEPAAAAAPCADAVDAAEQPPVDTLSFGTAAAGGQGGERDPAARCDTCSIGGSSSSSTTGSQQAVGAAQAAVAGCSDQHSMAGTAAAASAAAAAGYQLYYACCTHRHDSVAVELLWLVLTGQLPEAMLLQQQQQLQAVVTVLHKLKAAAGAAMDALPDATAGQSVGAAAAGQAATNSSSSAAVPWSKLVSSLQVCWSVLYMHGCSPVLHMVVQSRHISGQSGRARGC